MTELYDGAIVGIVFGVVSLMFVLISCAYCKKRNGEKARLANSKKLNNKEKASPVKHKFGRKKGIDLSIFIAHKSPCEVNYRLEFGVLKVMVYMK